MTEIDAVPPRRAWRQVAISTVVWLAVASLVAWSVVRVDGLEPGFPVIQLIAFSGYAALAGLVLAPVALALRRRTAAAAAAAAAFALVACVAPRWFPDGGRLPSGPRLRVLSVNMLMGDADPDAIVALVRTHRVDLLAVQELTPEAADRLDAAGLAGALPNGSVHPVSGVRGSALFSRWPLRDDGLRLNPAGFGQARATLTVAGAAPVEVESVHPCAPADRSRTGCWAAGLVGQPPATVDSVVRVLLGDFNATLDHWPLRRLLATGYRDAADVVGAGLTGTWPMDKPVPKIALDHVLADRRVGVRRFAAYPVPNSDHRAVFAELALPPG